jgi:hypothetical protein
MTLTPDQRAKVNAWMAAFRYGSQVDDLSKVDARHGSGRYDEATWNIALDAGTLLGHNAEFREHLVAAVEHGLSDEECEKHAYNMTALTVGVDTDGDWAAPAWATPQN